MSSANTVRPVAIAIAAVRRRFTARRHPSAYSLCLPLAMCAFACTSSYEPVIVAFSTPATDPLTATDSAASCAPIRGVQWHRPEDATARTWADATAYCDALCPEGEPWRLPTKPELESLIDDTARDGAIHTIADIDQPGDMVWTSSAHGIAGVWVIDVEGRSFVTEQVAEARTLCIRGEPTAVPVDRFVVSAPGVIDDVHTGLGWQQTAAPQSYSRADAEAYCASLTLDGGDFRLPTRAELLTLVDLDRKWPAINTTVFPDTLSTTFYWTTTDYTGAQDNAWIVFFDLGKTDHTNITALGAVRCVR